MGKYTVREDGRNGTIEIGPTIITRTFKKVVGRNDREIIPMKSIASAHHDRKRVGTDVVTVFTSGKTFEWKIKRSGNARQMVDEITHYLTA